MEKFIERLRKLLKKLLKLSLKNRYILLEVDLILGVLAFSAAIFIHTRMLNVSYPLNNLIVLAVIFSFISLIVFVLLKSNRSLVRHSNFLEFWRLYLSLLLSSLALYLVLLLWDFGINNLIFFVQRLFLIDLFLLLSARFFMVLIYNFTISYNVKVAKNALIFGTESHSISLMQWLNKTASSQYKVHGFVSRSKADSKTRIHDLPVFYVGKENHPDWFLHRNNVTTIIFPDYKTLNDETQCIELCIEMGLTVLVSPPFEGLDSNNKVRFQMKPIQFEDLLGRKEIIINMDLISSQTNGKTILVTGGAGSIGSELVRQLAVFNPKLIIIFDLAESPLHNLRLEMESNFPNLRFVPVIGDVRSQKRLDFVFRKYQPDIIYHAAAYKHVPLMEENPCEAILTNVVGTMMLSKKAIEWGVKSFVMISTDKAVNPTNVMGASKRIAEIYIQSLATHILHTDKHTNFVTTRFGNVLGSNGSVIPYFKEQIEKGGPVTVTHPDIIRYFMTIPEACRLVMEAASFGKSGEIYVFDMGYPVKIVDLAKKMIELAGFIPNKDIKIEFVGLRPGEKLFEELLNDSELTMPTSHEKITKAKVRQYDFLEVESAINAIILASEEVDVQKTVLLMKELVPEFISQNSPFECLDNITALSHKEEQAPVCLERI